MKKLLSYLPFHFLLFLIAGISVQLTFSTWQLDQFWLAIVIMILAILTFFFRKLFAPTSWIFFFFLGMILSYWDDDRNNDLYFLKHQNEQLSSVLRIKEILKPNKYSDRYYAEVVQVDRLKTTGKILLNIRKDSSNQLFAVNDQILVRSLFSEIDPALNPHQFDYKRYLRNQGIYHQLYLNTHEFSSLETHISLLGRIGNLRARIQTSLAKEGFSEDELGVINALLLGQRKEVSKEIIDDYSRAGAIHILAISGLHVGILLLILSWLLKPLEFIKNGKFLKLIIIVLFLWFFAVLAGMSASVIRAVTMFSAVALGQFLGRNNAVVYSLVLSMFVLLISNPKFIVDVGFQLSYLAVYGIVTMQPKLASIWNPRWYVIDKVWQLTTVSVAAQLAVLPLSLFYFHQFPALFLVSNLVIVPFLGIILIGGIAVLLMSVFSILPEFLVIVYGKIISWMNEFVRFVSLQEDFLFTDISFSFNMILVSYLLIVFGFRLFEKRNAERLVYCLIALVLIQSVFFYERMEARNQEEFLVLHKNKETVMGYRTGRVLITNRSEDAAIRSYSVGEKIEEISSNIPKNYLEYHNHQILIMDSLGVYPVEELKSPVVILQNSPKINLNRLIQELEPTQIVADGTNYRSLIKRWKKTCQISKVPFWYTRENGAYRLK